MIMKITDIICFFIFSEPSLAWRNDPSNDQMKFGHQRRQQQPPPVILNSSSGTPPVGSVHASTFWAQAPVPQQMPSSVLPSQPVPQQVTTWVTPQPAPQQVTTWVVQQPPVVVQPPGPPPVVTVYTSVVAGQAQEPVPVTTTVLAPPPVVQPSPPSVQSSKPFVTVWATPGAPAVTASSSGSTGSTGNSGNGGSSSGAHCDIGYTYCGSVLTSGGHNFSPQAIQEAYCGGIKDFCPGGKNATNIEEAVFYCLGPDPTQGAKVALMCACGGKCMNDKSTAYIAHCDQPCFNKCPA